MSELHIKVKNGQITNEFTLLQGTYVTETGDKIHDSQNLSIEQKHALGLYPVVEFKPYYSEEYQRLINPTYTIVGDVVELRYEVENLTAFYPALVEKRLIDFAKEKDIDIEEIGMLLNCNNLAWRSEAERFMNLYADTWAAFYATQSDDWLVIESELPVLSWQHD